METTFSYDFPEISTNEDFSLLDQLNTNKETNNLNFDDYRNKISNDLYDIESEIIKGLIQHDQQFASMFKNFDEAENIINTLESSLTDYKEQITEINKEMLSLQNKTNEISNKLTNRKKFEEELFTLLDAIILHPDFLNDITNNEIDDDYANKIKKLDDKLQIFISGDLPSSLAINEIGNFPFLT